ncbi:MAG: response regulator transcription factor [Owenweeksia sp.]|nr:response regulator transcription factor [Owenweeksia sp.]
MSMESIVLAEDHQLIIEGYRLLINKIDNLEIIATALDGQETIEAIETHRPNYLILDLHMPKVNGLDVLRYVSENHPETKVIIISMFGDPAMHQEVVRLGARAYLLKHADQDEFIMAIQLVMKGKSYFSPEIFTERAGLKTAPNSTPVIPLVSLTHREEEVLTLIANGYTNKEIARKLIISPKTVDAHRVNLMKKLDVHNVTGIVKYAIANGYDVQ